MIYWFFKANRAVPLHLRDKIYPDPGAIMWGNISEKMSNIIQTTGKHEQNFFLTGEKH